MHETDIVSQELQEFKIQDRVFKYKIPDTGDDLDYSDYYTEKEEVEDNGEKIIRSKINGLKLLKARLMNLKEVPYTQEQINKAIEIDHAWPELDIDQRYNFIRALHPTISSEIINNMKSLSSPLDLKN